MRYSFGLGESSLDHCRREEFPPSNVKNLRIVSRIPDLILSIYIQDPLSDERMYLRVYLMSSVTMMHGLNKHIFFPIIRFILLFYDFWTNARESVLSVFCKYFLHLMDRKRNLFCNGFNRDSYV